MVADQNDHVLTAAVVRHARLFAETVIPWQTLSGLAWLFAGVFCVNSTPRLFTDWRMIPLIIAVVAARCSGMCWNRLIDWQIDARNPRTARRPVPSGRMSQIELALLALLTLSVFLVSCAFLPFSGQMMGIFIAVAILVYSFAKRYTAGCHFVLGVIHACLPLAGSISQCDHVTLSAALFSIAAFASISGSDILYALQDEVFDKKFGLFSIPARFGTASSLETACTLHSLAIVACTLALAYADVAVPSYIVWGIGLIVLLRAWRSIWTDPKTKTPHLFPALVTTFSGASCLTLIVDNLWKALL